MKRCNIQNFILSVFILAACSIFSSAAETQTHGLKFSLERLTYIEGEKSISVSLRNTDKVPFLIQANMKWLNEETGLNILDKKAPFPFVITPPLYKLEPGEYHSWRVFYAKQNGKLADDRESVFLVQLKAIPSTNEDHQSVQFTVMRTLLFKIYYRPEKLKDIQLEDVAEKLTFRKQGNQLFVRNNMPIYATFNILTVGNYSLKEEQLYVSVAPFSEQKYEIPEDATGIVTWNILDEYLFPTKTHTASLN